MQYTASRKHGPQSRPMMWVSCSHWGMHPCHLFEPVPSSAYIEW